LRGFYAAACLTLAIVSSANIVAPETRAGADKANQRVDSGFRLLELGGRNARWVVPKSGLPATIRYAFLPEPAQFPGARNCDAMLPPDAALKSSHIALSEFRREVRAAFSTWEKAANIVFVETASVADAGILIGADAKARGRAFTNVALGNEAGAAASGMGAIRQSLICLNPRRPWKIGFDGNLDVYDLRFTITHEIGHAIGLDHPSPEGQLMSFRYVETARDLQRGDIAGAVALYGRPGRSSSAAATPPSGTAPPVASGGRAFGIGEPAPSGRGSR
jgi:hypothetical protein